MPRSAKPSNIVKRHDGCFEVEMTFDGTVAKAFGKQPDRKGRYRIRRSLKTHNPSEAHTRSHKVIAECIGPNP